VAGDVPALNPAGYILLQQRQAQASGGNEYPSCTPSSQNTSNELVQKTRIWTMRVAFQSLTWGFVVLRHLAIDSSMTLKHHQFAGVFAWLISLLLLSPAMVWSLPGHECNTERDPTEASQVEIDEVTLSESHSTQRQTRGTRSGIRRVFRVSRVGSSNPQTWSIPRRAAGYVSLQGRCGLLTC